MAAERCEECGFDGDRWTDEEAITAVAGLPGRWRRAIDGLDPTDLGRRPIRGMWSIAEYSDHVRETIFGMRFILEIALTDPGADLGSSPTSEFEPEARAVDVEVAIARFEDEVRLLVERVRRISSEEWRSSVSVDGDVVDVHYMVRHAVHDVTHHLGDLQRLRAAL